MTFDPSIFLQAATGTRSPAEYAAINAQINQSNVATQKERMDIENARMAQDKQAKINAIARKYQGPEGFNTAGFLREYGSVDPMGAQNLGHKFNQDQALTQQQQFKATQEERASQNQGLDVQGKIRTMAAKTANSLVGLGDKDYAKAWPAVAQQFNTTIKGLGPQASQWALDPNTPPPKAMIEQLAKADTPYKEENSSVSYNNWIDQKTGKPTVYATDKQGNHTKVEGVAPIPNRTTASNASLGGKTKTAGPGVTGLDYLNTLPKPRAALINGIVTGAEEAPNPRSKIYESMMNDVFAVDPGWTRQRAQIRKAFATGKDGTNIGSLNTASVHLGDLLEAGEALKNGTFRPGNELYQRFSEMFGHSMPMDYDTFKTVSSGELANALKGNATDVEIHSIKQVLDRSGSPEQLSSSAKDYLKTLNQKLKTYEERYRAEVPGDAWSPILPSAKSVFDKYGISSAHGTATGTSSKWQAKDPVGNPDTTTIGTNKRFPAAVWVGSGASDGAGWYVREGNQARRVE